MDQARDQVRALVKTEAYAHAGRRRKRIERLFGHLQRKLKLGTLKLRGLAGAIQEFTRDGLAQGIELRLGSLDTLAAMEQAMNDQSDASRVTTASADEVKAAGDAVPLEDRPGAPMRHGTAQGASIVINETSGVAAAEATGKLQADNEAPPGGDGRVGLIG